MASEEFDDFTRQVEQMQKRRIAQQKSFTSNDTSSNMAKSVSESVRIIAQVVGAFQSADSSLTVRESGNNIHISYAYTHICAISVAPLSENSVQVEFKILNFNQPLKNTIVYTGAVQKKEIQRIVKDELMAWYGSFN